MEVLLVNCGPVRNGATAEIIAMLQSRLQAEGNVRTICIDDYDIKFCKGCKACYATAECVIQDDDMPQIMKEYMLADRIVSVAPSYWADVPGQFKSFIDRCTPWCNTHEPHATIGDGKIGYAVALRTGANEKECGRIIESIEHFYGHLEIVPKDSLVLCSVSNKQDVAARRAEIEGFGSRILENG